MVYKNRQSTNFGRGVDCLYKRILHNGIYHYSVLLYFNIFLQKYQVLFLSFCLGGI
nr:MAG TPA: hypothetical protein [Caudoviricetes sp.]